MITRPKFRLSRWAFRPASTLRLGTASGELGPLGCLQAYDLDLATKALAWHSDALP